MTNVLFIRPSDNGYYGIAEALLDQPRDERVRPSLFRSTQFPLMDGVYRRWVKLAANKRTGRWQNQVCDPITRTICRRSFDVE